MFGLDLSSLGNVVKDVREAITGEKIKDPVKLKEVEVTLQMLENQLLNSQAEINKKEAESPNLFIAGWRPFIGWVGGFALAYSFILQPIIQWVLAIKGINVNPPEIDGTMLFNIVIAMLGIGSMRTYEKLKKVNDNHK